MTRERTCDLDHEPLRRELREKQISHGQCPACDQDLSDNEGDVAARILFIDRYYAGKSPADANGLVWTYRNWMNPLRSSLHNYEGYDWTSGAYHQIIASTTQAFVLEQIRIYDLDPLDQLELDVATGPAACEIVVLRLRPFPPHPTDGPRWNSLAVGIPIPARVRVSARIRAASRVGRLKWWHWWTTKQPVTARIELGLRPVVELQQAEFWPETWPRVEG